MLARTLQVIKAFFSEITSYPCFASFPTDSSGLAFPLYFPSTALASFFAVVALILCFKRTRTSAKAVAPSLHPLACLLHVLTPACSLWPQTYLQLTLSKPRLLRVPLKTVISDIISGKVELRAPKEDLRRLLAGNGRLDIGGCVLVLSVGLPLRLNVLCWWMKTGVYAGRNTTHLPRLQHGQISLEESKAGRGLIACELDAGSTHFNPSSQGSARRLPVFRSQDHNLKLTDPASKPHSVLPLLLSTLPPHILRKLVMATTLDGIPLARLETALLTIQPGSLALLEFTSCDPRVSPGSTAWVLAALPLARARHASRTATLPGVLALLESGGCMVLSVQNVSTQYALLLEDYARDLESGVTRGRFTERGVEGTPELDVWRAEKLWAHWEAACYVTGGLTRWVVCVKRLPVH